VGRSIPTQPWLRKGWSRDRAAVTARGVAQLRSSLEHPLVRRVIPPDVADGLFHLYAEREVLLDALDRLPQAFCHLDAHRRNLFARGGTPGTWQTVAMPWGGAGTAAVGVEIVRLVQMSLAFYAVEIDELSELDAMVYDGYLEGLRDAGWHGDPRIVRLGYAAETGIFVWGGGGVRGTCAVLPDERRHAWLEQLLGRSMEEQVARDARHYRFRLALAGEARELMDSLS
jgi:hypothetical protein